MKTRPLVSLIITAAVMLIAVRNSGAPFRVHVAEFAALVIGFTIPAIFIRGSHDLLGRWRPIVPAVLLGAVAFDFGMGATVSKTEAFSHAAVYIALPVATLLLLIFHAFVMDTAILLHRRAA